MNNVLVVEENKYNYHMGLVLLILSLDGEDEIDACLKYDDFSLFMILSEVLLYIG